MEVYLSFSYRDALINEHFFEQFKDEGIALLGDQKSETWCVAKLERYLTELTGFVSIVPVRANETDPGGYSEYIGQELELARRARVPRLVFVDERVHRHHRVELPADVVPFRPDELASQMADLSKAIRAFGARLEERRRPPREPRTGEVAVIVGKGALLSEAADDVSELLHRAGFNPRRLSTAAVLDDVRPLESLWSAELCVFLLDKRLSDAHLALAMAHAHGIPSIRLPYDAQAKDCAPSLTGAIRWRSRGDLIIEFSRQLEEYREGFVSPVDARAIGTTSWRPRTDNYWDMLDGPALVDHVQPEHTFIQDELARARGARGRALGRMQSREESDQVAETLYNGIKRHRYPYEFEAVSNADGHQAIRTPERIRAHRAATCLDLVCLFAALFEGAHQRPVIAVLRGESFAHAVAGYRVSDAPPIDDPSLGDVRAAVNRGDIVLFEATGACEADEPVAAEAPGARIEKLLPYGDALLAAKELLRGDVGLIHFIDVAMLRADRAF